MSQNQNPVIRPEHFEALLNARLSDAFSPLLLADDLSEQELAHSRTLVNARRFLEALREEAPVRATQKLGNLSRAFSTRLFRELEWPGDRYVEYIGARRTHVDEADLPMLYQLRVVLQHSGLVRKHRGAFYPTQRAERLLDRQQLGEVYRAVFLGWFDKTNIALADGMAEDPVMQAHFPFTLWVLRHKASDWTTAEELAPYLPHDEEMWHFEQRRWDSRFSGAGSRSSLVSSAFAHRILAPLVDFGLMESDPPTLARWDETPRWRITPLFDRFVAFDFSATAKSVPAGSGKDAMADERAKAVAEARELYSDDVVTLKITLRGTKPPVWRRVEVPATYDLGAVHGVLNTAMGWWDCHLHEFDIEGRRYGVPDLDFFPEDDVTLPEENIILGDLPRAGVDRFIYRYDFGDGWTHTVEIEDIAPGEPDVFYPRCTDGRRAPVPEDCGGVGGFADFVKAMASATHPQHAELKSWYGSDYDPAHFSAEDVSRALHTFVTGELPPDWADPE